MKNARVKVKLAATLRKMPAPVVERVGAGPVLAAAAGTKARNVTIARERAKRDDT